MHKVPQLVLAVPALSFITNSLYDLRDFISVVGIEFASKTFDWGTLSDFLSYTENQTKVR